ncbi:hypothetical protein LX32DRAFT_94185 [Colletotrichum zoysiae]|uniref:Uncharacterized protein n=1 Tax=Colletotrichum zoysiae TaxID=1216348 RepID=A0AAD9HAZ9_9PEZI|nr:hypothetical protein LX32DRAFT_94185 [Colletotrichum zoysiae]
MQLVVWRMGRFGDGWCMPECGVFLVRGGPADEASRRDEYRSPCWSRFMSIKCRGGCREQDEMGGSGGGARAQTAHSDWLHGGIPRCVSESERTTTATTCSPWCAARMAPGGETKQRSSAWRGLRLREPVRLPKLASRIVGWVFQRSEKAHPGCLLRLLVLVLFLSSSLPQPEERGMACWWHRRVIRFLQLHAMAAHCTLHIAAFVSDGRGCTWSLIVQLTCARRRHNPDSQQRQRVPTNPSLRYCRLDGRARPLSPTRDPGP